MEIRRSSIYGFDFARAAQILTDAAARAGAAIVKHFHVTAGVEFKDDRTPVTRADRNSEAIILEALKRLAPEVPVVSEKSGATATRLRERFFLVDSLDGTKEFIKKRSDFTVNTALIEKGRPRFGLVYAPALSLLAITNARRLRLSFHRMRREPTLLPFSTRGYAPAWLIPKV